MITDMSSQNFERFIAFSIQVTGFSRFELLGTGQARCYYDWIQTQSADDFENLLAVYAEAPSAESAREAYLETQIMQSDRLGPLARSIIKLWYLGQWEDPARIKEVQILSAQSYQQGLVWNAIHAHPQGAKQQGFGAWAEAPQPSFADEVNP